MSGGQRRSSGGLLGREAELGAIVGLLEAARAGQSGAIVVRGEAGMGKSVLLAAAAEHARATDIPIRDVRGIPGEVDFGFAGLQRLLIPFMDGYGSLPRLQREALGAALGLTDAGTPDRFLVGLAALTLLAEADPELPQLLVIDDAHWLDRESLDTLVFVSRRLQAESLAILFGTRPEGAAARAFDGIPVLDLPGLSIEVTTQLLAVASGEAVDPEVGRRVATGTQGCPLAVVELAGDLSPAQLIGSVSLPDPLPIGERLEELYLQRVLALPTSTQQLLLIAAADSGAHLHTVLSAGALAGLDADVLDAAQLKGLVDVGATITFRHPLVRSAVYRGAAPADRRRAHALLAQVTDPDAEPDAWVWHRAHAASGTDEDVAAALESRSIEVERRGRYSARAALMSRAAALTPNARTRVRRTLAAANALSLVGALGEAKALLDTAQLDHADPLTRAHAKRLEANLMSGLRPADALPVLIDAARSLEAVDPPLAHEAYAEGLYLAAISSHLADRRLVEQLTAAALAAVERHGASPYADLIRALASRVTGDDDPAAIALVRTALESMRHAEAPRTFYNWTPVGGLLASDLFDIDWHLEFLAANAAVQRSRGALDLLRGTLAGQSQAETWCGRLDRAEALRMEAGEIARALGDDNVVWRQLIGAMLSAWRADEAACRATIEMLHSAAVSETRNGLLVNVAHLSLAILENSLGNYAAALEAAWPLLDRRPVLNLRSLAEIVEAGHRCGRDDAAEEALRRLEQMSAVRGTGWAAGLYSRGAAIMADDDAEPHFVSSIAELGATQIRTELARTHLLYGEWLRRQNRRQDARAELTTAYRMFTEMGAPRFASRAARELAATGAVVRRRAPSTGGEPLTPQEEAIVQLAAGAATNREIAASLFLSPSTVDYHLRKIYRKLGVDSRRKLAAALAERSALS